MTAPRISWPFSSIILVLAGVALVVVGLYFILLRPPLLPEDVRYMGLSAVQLDPIRPRLQGWLSQVFRIMGGYIAATGALTITLAATSFREHRWSAAIGAFIGGVLSIAWMAVVNFMLDSDFKWILLVMALVWAFSLGLFCSEKNNADTS